MTTFLDRQNNYLTKAVALISTVFLAWTVAQGQQTPKELGQAIFEILKSKNITALDSLNLTVDEWTALAKLNKMNEKEISQYKDTITNYRKELTDRFANIISDGTNEGINWAEIILDSIQVHEQTFPVGDCLDCPNKGKGKETSITINFSYKKRRFDIGIRVFQHKDKWEIGEKPNEIVFSELITIYKKIGE